MIDIAVSYIKSTSLTWLLVAPFVTWLLGEVLFLGFGPPLFLGKSTGARDWVQALQVGIRRTVAYRGELFFAAIGLDVLTVGLFVLITMGEKTLRSFPELIGLVLGIFLLILLFFAKSKYIWSKPPLGGFLRSIPCIVCGYANPFKSKKVYHLNKVNYDR